METLVRKFTYEVNDKNPGKTNLQMKLTKEALVRKNYKRG